MFKKSSLIQIQSWKRENLTEPVKGSLRHTLRVTARGRISTIQFCERRWRKPLCCCPAQCFLSPGRWGPELPGVRRPERHSYRQTSSQGCVEKEACLPWRLEEIQPKGHIQMVAVFMSPQQVQCEEPTSDMMELNNVVPTGPKLHLLPISSCVDIYVDWILTLTSLFMSYLVQLILYLCNCQIEYSNLNTRVSHSSITFYLSGFVPSFQPVKIALHLVYDTQSMILSLRLTSFHTCCEKQHIV